jgi:hypothetical protein
MARPLYPRETARGTHWIGWVSPRADLDAVEQRKSLLPLLGIQLQQSYKKGKAIPVRGHEGP